MYPFSLEKYSGSNSRFPCPRCGTPKSFTRYISNVSGMYLGNDVGKCNRINKCNYHYSPKDFFRDGNTFIEERNLKIKAEVVEKPISFIDSEQLINSLNNYSDNNFVKYLLKIAPESEVKKTIEKFYIGTSTFWQNSTVFWQIDIEGRIRCGKVILYDEKTGKRVKSPFPHINWYHKILGINDFNLKQCLFGEHQLIKSPTSTIGLVESEKTAIIASIHLPNLTWLATGGIHNLEPEKCSALKNKKVIMFPDMNAYEIWEKKADKLTTSLNCSIKISDILDKNIPNEIKLSGADIIDFIIK